MGKFHEKILNSEKSFVVILIFLLFLTAFFALFLGRYSVSPKTVCTILFNKLIGVELSTKEASIVLGVRIPRMLLTILVGGGLAISGATFQGIFQNPLVSPDVLGVSSGAAFGAALGILISGNSNVVIFTAMIFGLIGVFFTYSLSKIDKTTSTLSLVLSGMIISALFNALVSLVKYTADPDTKLPEITYWLMGSFSNASYNNIKLVFLPILVGSIVLFALRYKVNILSLGDEEAYALGINPQNTRLIIIIAAAVTTASCITVCGIVGWVGLIIPHISRMLVGVDHNRVIPASAILGAIFMIIIDVVARSAMAAEIPVGILTALIGAPFFAVIFKRFKGVIL